MADSSDETMVEMQEGASSVSAKVLLDVSVSAETVFESTEGSETSDDNYYCEKCKSSFKTQCDVHGPPVFALDHPTRVGIAQRALLTLPTNLVVGWSRAKEGCLGVFNLGQVVPVGMHFGPYDGEVVSEEEALKSVYSWVICKGKDCYGFIDATRDTHSNWMRFVTCSRDSREQNLVAYQQGGRLLFRCCAPIRSGQELLVWYAEDYARSLGLIWDQLWDYKCSTNTDTASSQVLSCPYCRFTFLAKSYLQRHVRRSHTEQYQNFLETHCAKSKEEEPLMNLDTCQLGSDVPPSVQMEPYECTGKQGSESLIGQASHQSGTPEQQSHQSNGTRCWNNTGESDWSQDTSSASPSNDNGHSCSQCGRSFARACHLKRHEEAVHSPDKMYCWGRGHRSQRKPPNPRRHRQSPDKELEEEEVAERDEADGKRVQSVLESLSCLQCSTDFNTQQELQEHIEQHHSQGQGSNCEGERSEAAMLLGKLSSVLELSEAADFVDPSDPLYEPTSRKPRMRRAGLKMPAQKRGRGRPRTRPIMLALPKRKRPQKIQRDNSEPRPPDQMQVDGQRGEEVLTNGVIVATSLGSSPQMQPEPDAQMGTQLTCAECQRMFADLATLQSHECVQEGEGLYSCSQCSLHFSQASNLRRHQRSVHALVKPYCCFPCGKFYTQASGLRRHQEGRQHKKHRGLAGVKGDVESGTITPSVAPIASIYSCTYCQFSFTAQRYLHKHIKRHHPAEFVQALDGDGEGLGEGMQMPQSCPQCDKTFVSIKGFKSHRCFRRGEKVFLCPVCSKSFTSLYSLQQHQRVHTGEKPYPCPHCSKSFAVGGQLNVHLRTHTGERPYLCAQCGEGFRQSGDLKRHEQKHLGVRPHQCPQCNKSFSRPQSLRAHLQTHSGQRLFHCTQCNKAFTRGYHLTRHHHKMHS